jgi:hypothetical protein
MADERKPAVVTIPSDGLRALLDLRNTLRSLTAANAGQKLPPEKHVFLCPEKGMKTTSDIQLPHSRKWTFIRRSLPIIALSGVYKDRLVAEVSRNSEHRRRISEMASAPALADLIQWMAASIQPHTRGSMEKLARRKSCPHSKPPGRSIPRSAQRWHQ